MPTLQKFWSDAELLSVVHIGLCFTVLFSADFTLTYMQKSVTTSITEDNPSFAVDGYVTLATVYGVYGISLWLGPSFLLATGPKLCLAIGSFCYILHPLSFLTEKLWVTFLALVLAGIGGSLLWVAHGNYMIRMSSERTMPRNIGVFWALYSAAMIPGNIYAAFNLHGKYRIDRSTRQTLLISLGLVASVATILFVFLRSPPKIQAANNDKSGPILALKTTWKIFWSKSMMILLITFTYTGFQQAFGSGVYGPCIGFTKQFGEKSKQLIPISGLCYGLGEIIGGLIQIITSRVLNEFKYLPGAAIITGFSIQTIGFALISVSLPDNAVFGETLDTPIISASSSIPLVLVSAVMLGFGDSVLNTQIYPLLALLQPECSAQTCALYKFTKSMAMVIYFLCSTQIGLYAQLTALCITGLLGSVCFIIVERWSRVNTGLYIYN